jgi:hypothetical protein
MTQLFSRALSFLITPLLCIRNWLLTFKLITVSALHRKWQFLSVYSTYESRRNSAKFIDQLSYYQYL